MNPYTQWYNYCDQCGEGSIFKRDGRLFCLNHCDLSSARECPCGGYYVGPADRCSVCEDLEKNKDLATI